MLRSLRLPGCLLRLALVAGACAAVAVPASAEKASSFSRFKLSNGLEGYVIHDHRLPIVSHSLWYRVGATDERDGEAGLAHFLEHLLFKGTEQTPGLVFTRFAGTNGGIQNAFTTADTTVYFQRVPKDKLRRLMELEADRMANLKLVEADVNTERGAVLEELRRNLNNPFFKLNVAVNEQLFPGTTYSRPVIGYEADIKAMTHASALSFYRRYYAPNNAVLIVAGDVTLDEVKSIAEVTYGRAMRREVLPRVAHTPTMRPKSDRVVVEHDQVRTPTVGLRYVTPGTMTIPQDDEAALSMLSQILSVGQTSRMHRALVQKGLAVSGQGGLVTFRGVGTFWFSAGSAQGTQVGALEKAMHELVLDLGKNPVTKAELDEYRPLILKARAERLDNQFGRLETLGTLLMEGRTLEDLLAWDARIDRVTAEDVNRAVAAYLLRDRSMVVHLLPRVAAAAPAQAPSKN